MSSLIKKLSVGIAIIVVITIGVPTAQYAWYLLRGHYVGGVMVAGDIAKMIAERHLDPRECLKIEYNPFDLYRYPSLGSIRDGCIAAVAVKTKDPSVCELLLPSEYGWSCFGEISGELFSGRLCTRTGALDHPVVYCNRDSEGETTIDRPQIENCQFYKRNDLRDWCYDARTELLKDSHDCSMITRDVMRDHCEYSYALKLRDPLLCAAIADTERRSFCVIRVGMAHKYTPPSFSTLQ